MKNIKILISLFLYLYLSIGATDTYKTNKEYSRGYIVKVGESCPDFNLKFPDGTISSFEELRGDVIMIQFTASWCSVCREEMPHIEKEIWKKYKKAGLKLIGIDKDESKDVVEKFAKEMKITYPLALDSGSVIFEKFAEKDAGVTRNIIINPNGDIVYLTRLFDYKEFQMMIEVIHLELKNKIEKNIDLLKRRLKRLIMLRPKGKLRSGNIGDLAKRIKQTRAAIRDLQEKNNLLKKIERS